MVVAEDVCNTMTQQYIDSFLRWRCAPDILGIVSPVQRASKEITEVYTMFRALRKLIPPADSYKYEVLDLCAGNGLLGVAIAHVFNYSFVTSLDIKVPNRKWAEVRKFSYYEMDINSLKEVDVKGKIIVANHPCQNATNIVESFCKYNAKALVLMPCCSGKLKPRPQWMIKKLGKYGAWCADLYDAIIPYALVHKEDIKVNMYEDTNCLSPKNIVITAIRENYYV